jgi:hypothetical protein
MLRTICIWSVHDFPTFGLFAGCVMKGHKGCPPCGPTTKARSSKKLNKIIYCGSCHYLPINHPYRHNKNVFNGTTKMFSMAKQKLGVHQNGNYG